MGFMELREAVTSNPWLNFEHGYGRWKKLDEKKTMTPLRRGFKMVGEKKIFNNTSPKRYLGGWVSYNEAKNFIKDKNGGRDLLSQCLKDLTTMSEDLLVIQVSQLKKPYK
jgi:hypothetical protein